MACSACRADAKIIPTVSAATQAKQVNPGDFVGNGDGAGTDEDARMVCRYYCRSICRRLSCNRLIESTRTPGNNAAGVVNLSYLKRHHLTARITGNTATDYDSERHVACCGIGEYLAVDEYRFTRAGLPGSIPAIDDNLNVPHRTGQVC